VENERELRESAAPRLDVHQLGFKGQMYGHSCVETYSVVTLHCCQKESSRPQVSYRAALISISRPLTCRLLSSRVAAMNPKHLADLRFVQSPPVRDRVRHRPSRVAQNVTSSLYLFHLLSTCGGRMSEYSYVFFLAFNHPGTLFYISVYNIAGCLAVLLQSSWIGAYIDEQLRLYNHQEL
jgi:Ferroportin1 (FPN1)